MINSKRIYCQTSNVKLLKNSILRNIVFRHYLPERLHKKHQFLSLDCNIKQLFSYKKPLLDEVKTYDFYSVQYPVYIIGCYKISGYKRPMFIHLYIRLHSDVKPMIKTTKDKTWLNL